MRVERESDREIVTSRRGKRIAFQSGYAANRPPLFIFCSLQILHHCRRNIMCLLQLAGR